MKPTLRRYGVLLVAGNGSRFSGSDQLTGNKHLTTIDGEPLIVHGVRHLLHTGATHILVAASPENAAVFRALFCGSAWPMVEVVTIPETFGVPATFAQTLKHIDPVMASLSVRLLLGDNFFPPALFPYEQVAALAARVDAGENAGLLALIEDPQAAERAVVTLNTTGQVQSIREKPTGVTSALVATGFYVLPRAQALVACEQVPLSPRGEKETGDMLQALLDAGTQFSAVRLPPEGRIAVDRRSDVAKVAKLVIPPSFRAHKPVLPAIFITGIAGFVGSRLAHRLVALGHPVYGVDDFSTGYLENIPLQLQEGREWIKLDLTTAGAVKRLAPLLREARQAGGGVLHIVHTACPAYDALSNVLSRYVTAGVAVGTAAILSAAVNAGAARFINCSSMARYEALSMDLHRKWTGYREDDPTTVGMSPYGNAKLAAEKLMRSLLDTYGIPWTNIVMHNLVGVGQEYNNPLRNVAAMLMNMAVHGKPLYIQGDGRQQRVFTPWTDVEFAFIELVTDTHGRFDGLTLNLGPGAQHALSIRDLCEAIGRVAARRTGQPFAQDIRSMSTGTLASLKTAFCNDERCAALFGRSPAPDMEKVLDEMAREMLAREREFRYGILRKADLPLTRIPDYKKRVFRIQA